MRIKRFNWGMLAVAMGLLLALVSSAHAILVNNGVAPGEETLISFGADDEDNDTAVRFKNLSDATSTLDAQFIPGALKGDVAGGFKLLDGSLEISSSAPQGEKRVLIRMEVDPRRIRGKRFARAGIRIMRFDVRARRWLPAVQKIVNGGRADIRYIRGRRDFTLGHQGYAADKNYAWAVVDVTSRYAVGVLEVPEPTALLMAGAGASLLILRRRRHVAA